MWSLMIRSPNSDRREHQLEEGPNILGRHSDIDILISDHSASRKHATIVYDPEKDYLELTDMASTNGTFVNGTQVQGVYQLVHNDKIRIGRHLITVISHKERDEETRTVKQRTSVVTGELLLQSVESYAVLLHDIGYQLINIPELEEALDKISATVKQMLGAEECKILMREQIYILEEYGIPAKIYENVIENNSASIFALDDTGSIDTKLPEKSIMLVPVELDGEVAALIWAWKPTLPFGFSHESDLQLAIAVSHQVALSIQRNRVETELLHNAYYDQLTGLSNRTYFTERVKRALAWKKRHKDYLFAVIFMDLDNFKVVNDSLGHASGDQVLVALSERLMENLREQDTIARTDSVARFGGDEFSVFLDDITNERDAFIVANRLKEIIAEPFRINDQDIYISASIGITLNTLDYSLAEEMLRDAEIAMYRAKELGKSQVVIYDSVMHNTLVKRLVMETDLRKAMRNDEFRLYYQPIISIADEKIVGLEALLRWHSPERGYMEPRDFFGALNTSGLMSQLDTWVLEYAARDAARIQKLFPQDPPIYISANISANLVQNPQVVKIIENILAQNKLSTGSLRLEVTEKADLSQNQVSKEMFKALQERGIRISLDDFGTGYSTLSYLMSFPADALKIDYSFIRMLETNEESQRIVETLRALATHLNMHLIAEGIETEGQLKYLKALGCDYGQGFLFSKAVEFDKTVEFIRNNLNLPEDTRPRPKLADADPSSQD
jgi:diguanylate cyclase (GGDEF)-like protein